KLLTDANTGNNFKLSGGAFRTMADQIRTHAGWCVSDHKPQKLADGSWNKCSGAARPGYSNHQMGFAIDFSCNGYLDTSPAMRYYPNVLSTPYKDCFIWLENNSTNYYLFEFCRAKCDRSQGGYESWHWSINGG